MAAKKARVLVAAVIGGVLCKPDDVMSVDDKEAAFLAGSIDSDPAAVKYAEGLARKAKAPADQPAE